MKTRVNGKSSPYWSLMGKYDIIKDGEVYLHRRRVIQTPLFGIFLHDIYKEDQDPHPHDHPWNFATIVLRGGYTEELRRPSLLNRVDQHVWLRGSIHTMVRGQYHRILYCRPGTKTLVFTGKRKDTWGFLVNGRHVPWKTYLGLP